MNEKLKGQDVLLVKEKPHLQTNFKITGLAEALNVNRSVMSAFINRNYGVNFSRFVNQWWLKELGRLRLSPDHSEKDNLKLVLMAGFSSYRSYLRVKGREDRMSVLKEF